MTSREDETMDAYDDRKKVSDNLSVRCPKAQGMMATQKKPLEYLSNDKIQLNINNQRKDHKGDPESKEKLAEAKKKEKKRPYAIFLKG